jgi:hypothetical protein
MTAVCVEQLPKQLASSAVIGFEQSVELGSGLVIAGINALLLLTHALGTGWVFLIDVGCTATFARVRGWQRFGQEGTTSVRKPAPDRPWQT